MCWRNGHPTDGPPSDTDPVAGMKGSLNSKSGEEKKHVQRKPTPLPFFVESAGHMKQGDEKDQAPHPAFETHNKTA